MGEKIKGIIRVATEPKEFNGVLQIGFTLKAEPDKWYNIPGKEEDLKKLRAESIIKGTELEFDIDNGQVSNVTVINKAKEGDKWEDDIVNFETLLTAAHNKKIPFSIKTEMITVDLEKKYALFKAQVIVSECKIKDFTVPSQVFEGHGDATADNVTGDFIKPHFIRMAETRAIVRALRWYTNNAVAEEEKGGV